MTELNRFTQQMQSMLPQWMKMAKNPDSVGAQFLDVFGLQFEDVRTYMDEILGNQFIDSADISQIDITYKVPIALPTIIDFNQITTAVGYNAGVAYPLTIVSTLADFYSALTTSNTAIVDRTEGVLYVRPQDSIINTYLLNPFNVVQIDGVDHFDISLHHIWNAFDEFGLLLGINRLYGERNNNFKARILDVFINPGGANKQGIINGLSRELGITSDQIIINTLADPAFKNTLLNSDGSASKKLIQYAQTINKVLGFTWDNMSWGEAYWKSISEENIGFDYLPHVWDVTLGAWQNNQIQSGIGDNDDLLVTAPKSESNIRDFNYYVGLRGTIPSGELIYPEHSFKYKITAQGTILSTDAKPQNYKYTVISSEIISIYFTIRAFQQYMHTEVFNFTNTTGIVYDAGNNLEIITGQTVLSKKDDQYVEVQATLETTDQTVTPSLDSLTIQWQDTAAGIHNLLFDVQADFDRNDAIVTTTKENSISTTGNVQLGYGSFDHLIDSMGDWNKGTTFNVNILSTGTIVLAQ